MSGVHLKEKEIGNLLNLGLGGLLRELKKMKATGTGLYADKTAEKPKLSETKRGFLNNSSSADFAVNYASKLSIQTIE